ncbi:MAG: hypothetical protein COT92_01145 [Candidatus Doudnabacteria bacterium CG10_big_fil_rev_8_21_14_0_10_42_18]|uniref:ECF transporter S component n=1 Tax=Candidatus Doudnabacteria bacterium CG10_big_fil_rev_8_21_14_0_10_42_18 TaxID=1974552 RepID=A0A2H0VBE6_9BACT|nr:MAG: hypothetical protein COT92_01145 [Candidatus Doudnabacteria bacterium CG10_big_fil_rev_8_21_14_0_10_42_18]
MTQQRKKKLYFTIVFIAVGLLAFQVSLSKLVGSNVNFTLFDAFGPITAAFLGTLPGIIALIFIQGINFLIHGAQVIDAGTVIRFFPMLFAALYFARKTKWNIIIPLLAMLAFNLHPIGRSAWYYSLYWLIPVAMYFLQNKYLLARSLGATFTAHAVGGAAWVWAFGLSKEIWTGLIPVVAFERAMFAVGIAVMYVLVNNLVHALMAEKAKEANLGLEPKYLYKKI